MSRNSDHMEHRWGTRVPLNVPAGIQAGDGRVSEACVRNASISGAFVESGTRLPLLSRVSVNLRGGEMLDACIVRIDDRGMALEWLDPGSQLVPALLSMRLDSRDEVLQTPTERSFTLLASGRT